ncbi:FAD binding domain-containing protein [Biscogniauxia marginata]|nr:FAD binding domain-containing protein [Biscogniauxia marginata]
MYPNNRRDENGKARQHKEEEIRHNPEVCIIGAGPTGLMLSVLLARFGIDVEIIDERGEQTSTGRADGLQPKTIETLRQLRLADDLLRKGAKIYDICFWKATANEPLKRTSRACHYPSEVVDLLDNYILLVHQGMVEEILVEDLRGRGTYVKRDIRFEDINRQHEGYLPEAVCKVGTTGDKQTIPAEYVIGCDGAHSRVRGCIPDSYSAGKSSESIWGVLDGELITNFPDLWSKAVVYSEEQGSILIIPRERGMTRFYIEIKVGTESIKLRELGQEFLMQRAKQILAPYSIEWRTVEWFGNYQIGQRIANKFADPHLRVFIAGDASHSHSPKAAQGMNTGIHDAWNLAWKLNLTIRGLAKPALLESYELERQKIAHDLINFDYEHANWISSGDAEALAKNFKTNVRFISGVGVEYEENVLNQPQKFGEEEGLKIGCLVPPAKVTRYIDANPIDIQLDIPILGQFRVYFFVPDVHRSFSFLETLSTAVLGQESSLARTTQLAAASYADKPRPLTTDDAFVRPERFTGVSQLMTFALVTTMEKTTIEITDLPELFVRSAWTFYLDDVPNLDTRKDTCTSKWVGTMKNEEVAILNVRPDGYVGSFSKWNSLDKEAGPEAVEWLTSYYDEFLVAKN